MPSRRFFTRSFSGSGTVTSGGGAVGTAFLTGQTLGTLRSDFTASVGFQINVGGAPITVTQLGRWVIAGNNQTHVLRIFTDLFGSPTELGNVTVNTSGAPTAQYLYGTLGSPVVLSASTTYAIVSDEINASDQWYDSDTIVVPTAVGVVFSAVYRGGAAGGSGTFGASASTNNAFAPVNFKYT